MIDGRFRGSAGGFYCDLAIGREHGGVIVRGALDTDDLDGTLYLAGHDSEPLYRMTGTWVTMPSGRDNQHPETHSVRAELVRSAVSLRCTVFDGDSVLCALDLSRV